MSADAIDLAERRYWSLIGKHIVHTAPDGTTLTGRVLPGLYRFKSDGSRFFRVRSREVWYVPLDLAFRLRLAPMKKRRAA